MNGKHQVQHLVLGTAQFGFDYGIANRCGKVARNELSRILELGREHGVNTLDTAVNYGDAESRLGELGVNDFKVVTKIPAIPESVHDLEQWLLGLVRESLSRLRVERLHGLLVHHPSDLAGDVAPRLLNALNRLRDSGLAEKVGASIYSPSDLRSVRPIQGFGLVQAPMNVFDRRVVESSLINDLQQAGVEVHIRSTFLQGLLLMPSSEVPVYFNRWRPLLQQWYAWCNEQAMTPLEACLAHARASASGAKVVVGCDSAKQFEEIIKAAVKPPIVAPSELKCEDQSLINPTFWSRT